MELLLENIEKHVNLSLEEQELFLSLTERHHFKAKENLLKEGSVCSNSHFVYQGILRGYTLDENLVEHTLSFASTGWWIADMYSYLSGNSGNLIIEAVEETKTLSLSRANQLVLFDRIPKVERYFRILIENSLIANQQRILDNMSLTAEERFEAFSHKHADIQYLVSQKHIASFLGVTPEFFSRMKSRLLKKQ